VGIGIHKTNASIGIPVPDFSVRYRTKKMPDCVALLRYRIRCGIVSFFSVRYRTDRMPDKPAVRISLLKQKFKKTLAPESGPNGVLFDDKKTEGQKSRDQCCGSETIFFGSGSHFPSSFGSGSFLTSKKFRVHFRIRP
jgi:hypothetical protein